MSEISRVRFREGWNDRVQNVNPYGKVYRATSGSLIVNVPDDPSVVRWTPEEKQAYVSGFEAADAKIAELVMP